MRIWQKTDQGAIRKENQDACAVDFFWPVYRGGCV